MAVHHAQRPSNHSWKPGSGRSPDATASDSLVRRLRLLNPEVTQAAVIQRGRTLGIYRRAAELRASLREPCSATYPRSATPRVMAPLSLPLASLLKHSDCLQKAKAFCNVLQSPQHRPFTSRSWRRSPGAVARGAGHLLSRQPGSPNYAARVFRCSSGAQDTTERLRSVYNETKRQTQDLIPAILANSINPDTIFANNEMSLRDTEIYGFDYDYTLAFYSRDLHTLIFNIYFVFLLGLHYDVQKALLMKIDAFHYIQLGTVYRGLHPVPDEEVIAMYEGCHVPLENMSDFYGKSSHGHTMKQFMDIFSLPEMTLLCCVNDFFMKHNIDYEPVHLYKDVKEAIRDVHVKGIMYRAVEADIGKYICYGEQSHAVLKKLSEHGKKMFLITNSPFDFVDRGMNYIVGKDWRDLFDVVIVQADKPGFFNDRRKPFRRLEKGKIYKQIPETHAGEESKCFYSFWSTVLQDLTLKHGWRTGAIIPELRKEIKIMNTEQYMHMMAWLQALTGLIEQMQVHRDAASQAVVEEWIKEREDMRSQTKDIFNAQFGSLFRTYHNATYFSRRLSRFADIYMASISCLLNYDFQHTFFPRRTPLQHEGPFWPEHSPGGISVSPQLSKMNVDSD
uniref:5'-nucleotidase domain containing 3 n=1 Tax=Gasterosteus aculeatus aculeatus TaxID=481459 RepID=G3P6U1_GASAC